MKDGRQTEGKRRKVESEEDSDEVEEDLQDTTPRPPRHRVVAKGSNIPKELEEFQELQARYSVSSRLFGNLEQNGFKHPTGIQAYGIPILMEVGSQIFRVIVVDLDH